jgi:hypothetical protein
MKGLAVRRSGSEGGGEKGERSGFSTISDGQGLARILGRRDASCRKPIKSVAGGTEEQEPPVLAPPLDLLLEFFHFLNLLRNKFNILHDPQMVLNQ